MLFNSVSFVVFFVFVFAGYWLLQKRSLKIQNLLLMLCSYFFYACWDWRFLFLLIFSTFLDYYTGLRIYRSNGEAQRKMWLIISVSVNLGFLFVFKYYNFFAESFVSLLGLFGLKSGYTTLQVILPVGISFYTFHGLSYVFDIYNRKTTPTTSMVNYSLFVSFFPLLVAGPIERATHLLPQVEKPRTFDYTKAVDGLRQILWGLFCKVVIADNCAEYANEIFNNAAQYKASTLFMGALYFTFQIYGDFSGYSNIALGVARLLGFELLRNFSFPYFSRNMAEFWKRWHISLSSWFRDYLYIPLGGSQGSTWMKTRNVFIIFLVSGFWHGANWTFICWGALNALFVLPSILMKSKKKQSSIVAAGRILPGLQDVAAMGLTFLLTVLAWIFFRAESVSLAFHYLSGLCSASLLSKPEVFSLSVTLLIAGFMLIEWLGREEQFAIARFGFKWPRPIRWLFYFTIVFSIFYFAGSEQQFIYFQF